MPDQNILIYDSTLRDGAQGEHVSFSKDDKLRIAEKLDELGVAYIEGGWPGSNPRDAEFFRDAASRTFKYAKLCAFGCTRRKDLTAEDDPQLRALLDSGAPVCTIVGKTPASQVREILNGFAEEFGVARVGARPAAFDVCHAEFVQFFGNTQLVVL